MKDLSPLVWHACERTLEKNVVRQRLAMRGLSSRMVASCAAALVSFSAPLSAAETSPTAPYIDNNDGTVTHQVTGLTWKRCSEGQTWTGSTCTGTANTYGADQAKALTSDFAGMRDWRLPTIAELVTLDEGHNRYNPSTSPVAFPNAPPSRFWSGSLVAEGQGYAWRVSFYFGDSEYDRSDPVHVRLVRGTQPINLPAEFTPTADFIDKGDGTVVHKKTNLTWKRCAEGQTWTGSTCNGTAQTYTWTDANKLSIGGWRLPTKRELLTIIEWSKTASAINTDVFPNVPTTAFWSSSAYLGNSNWAWYVNFGNGNDHANYKTYALSARLVSGEQMFGAQLSTLPDCLFSWAEQRFSQFFPSSGGGSLTLGPYTYRQYGSNTFLAVSTQDNHLWTIFAGGAPLDLGPTSGWYATAECK